jgi:hypothetical protein
VERSEVILTLGGCGLDSLGSIPGIDIEVSVFTIQTFPSGAPPCPLYALMVRIASVIIMPGKQQQKL